jgi:peptidyl-tRNA hydrolase, PTH1 family
MKLIVGLGNPGKPYERTRHNVGYRVMDALGAAHHVTLKTKEAFRYAVFQVGGEQVAIVKLRSFMNRSGDALRQCVAHFPELTIAGIMIVSDDVNLPLGSMRLRAKGSAGGHHGLESIIEAFGDRSFPRLRIGIGRDGLSGADLTDYVLGEFEALEKPVLEKVLARASNACTDWAAKGIVAAMNCYNQEETDRGTG